MNEKSDELKRTMAFYCELMTEIKIRTGGIESLLRSAAAPAQIIYESCYLQLRLICELIAMSCLVVHGDIPATKTKRLSETWQADQIVKRLSEIHASFYPQPVRSSPESKFRVANVNDPHLTKTELIALYRKSGERLHRGAVKNARHRINPQNVAYDQIYAWQGKIVTLLQHHWVKLHDSDDQIGIQMNTAGQQVAWSYWKAMGASGIQ